LFELRGEGFHILGNELQAIDHGDRLTTATFRLTPDGSSLLIWREALGPGTATGIATATRAALVEFRVS
jgi:hypothetical protein